MGAGATQPMPPAALRPAAAADGPLVTVVYVSRVVGQHFADPRSVSGLVRFSAANNQMVGITGYLLVAMPFFLQRLEGPPEVLHPLLAGIKRDHRHEDVIVVEDCGISHRIYGDWAMKSFDTISSAGDRFDAVAFMLQSLSVALQVANQTLHPTLFRLLLAGTEEQLEDSVDQALVVTVALGPTVLKADVTECVVADLSALQTIAHHLRTRICSLNPEGRSPISLYAGAFLQVIVHIPPTSHNFTNKVLRACAELVSGHTGGQTYDIFITVEKGDVHILHIARPEDSRKGRYYYGAPLTRGLTLARRLLLAEVQATLVVSQVVAGTLQEEFRLQPIVIGGVPMRSVKLYAVPTRNAVHEYSKVDQVSSSTNATIAALLQMAEPPARLPDASTAPEQVPSEVDDNPPSDAVVGDLEWIYGLEPQAESELPTPAVKKLRGLHGRASRKKAARLDAAARLKSAPTLPNAALLNIVYVSMMADPMPMSAAQLTELGEQSGRSNGPRRVTGFLLCTRPFFLQCMEGPPNEVKELFLKIYQDPRHRNVTVLAFRHIAARSFGAWPMRTMDLDAETWLDMAPLREVLLLLTRQFTHLQSWLTRLHHDLLLSWIQLRPMAHTQCSVVAFAAVRKPDLEGVSGPAMLRALSPFLALGGEILGFLGDHLVGYTFTAAQGVLLEEVVDLCTCCDVHVGVASGPMLLVNMGGGGQHCDLAFYGPVFERARLLADRAVSMVVPILAETVCQAPVPSLVWELCGPVVIGRLDPEGAKAAAVATATPE